MTEAQLILRAPFPWFGGKSRVADDVWRAFGDVPNYVEPFFGSGAVLLGRPHAAHTETVNDADAYLANFWRALQTDPGGVAASADWPVNEADLSARHLWLVNAVEFRERMKTEPDYYDVKIAGWWVWGLCQWIGSGWCEVRERPHRKLPHLGGGGRGVHRQGKGQVLAEYVSALAERLRGVRVACGDWSRVLSDAVTWRNGLTAVFLDPPYDDGDMSYSVGGTGISSAVREWAIANGDNPQLRIALCGYEGEHIMPETWTVHAWKAKGGYASQGGGTNENARRERVWFSPHCVPMVAKQRGLFL